MTVPDPTAEKLLAFYRSRVEAELQAMLLGAIAGLSRTVFGIQLAEFKQRIDGLTPDKRAHFAAILSDAEIASRTLSKRFAAKWESEAMQLANDAVERVKAANPQAALSTDALFYTALEAVFDALLLRVRAIGAKVVEGLPKADEMPNEEEMPK